MNQHLQGKYFRTRHLNPDKSQTSNFKFNLNTSMGPM